MTALSSFFQTSKRHLVHGVVGLAAVSSMAHALAQTPTATPPRGTPDRAQMAERRIDHIIKEINGTPEQKTKLTALAQAAEKDMMPLREQLQTARRQGMSLLSAPTIDRAALEKLRSEQSQLMDALSRRMLAHMADAAEVLTPAQRSQLAEKMKARGERGGHGERGRGHHGMGGWWR
ncbi:MAG: Spy/CpxP family protein refolding chaperone [Brachymonas sp.]|nr:Spy/CpxP family protein refolding chaperone [Brachymonas sp.]